MSNPGPASTSTIHPSNLASNQAIRLLGVLTGVNVNATGDNAIPIQNSTNYSVANVIVTNASTSLTTAVCAVYPSANAQGTAIVAASTALSGNTGATVVNQLTVASTATQAGQNVYFRVTTAQGAAATADVYIYGYDFSNYNSVNPIGA
jgi:hypothetical protein